MTAQAEELRSQANHLRDLARDVEGLLAVQVKAATDLIGRREWLGPLAERTRGELNQSASRLRWMADDLRAEAHRRDAEARQLDEQRSLGQRADDLVTGRHTPWGSGPLGL